MNFLKDVWDTEGPLGIPMKDKQALQLEALLKDLPRDDLFKPGFLITEKATTELLPGEQADVSWISTEDRDRVLDMVIASGMNDEHFKLNPIVTLNHSYYCPPAGRSLWRKVISTGTTRGVKAKTVYPERPDHLPTDERWLPDCVFPLVEHGLLNGKSIGFLPTKVRVPSDEEKQKNPRLLHVHRIVEEWVLLEYALVYLPANANAVVGKKKGSRRKKVPEERKKKGSRNPYLARFLGNELDGVTGWAG